MNCLTQEKFESGSAENREKHVQVDWEKEIVSEYIPICRIQQQLSYFHKCFCFVYSQVLVDKFQILFPVVNWGSHSKIRNNTYIQELSWISVLISRQLNSLQCAPAATQACGQLVCFSHQLLSYHTALESILWTTGWKSQG